MLLLRRNSERKNRLSLLEDSARCSREFNHAARTYVLALGLKKMHCHHSRARVSLLCKCYSHIECKCATLTTAKDLVFSVITCYPRRKIVRGVIIDASPIQHASRCCKSLLSTPGWSVFETTADFDTYCTRYRISRWCLDYADRVCHESAPRIFLVDKRREAFGKLQSYTL